MFYTCIGLDYSIYIWEYSNIQSTLGQCGEIGFSLFLLLFFNHSPTTIMSLVYVYTQREQMTIQQQLNERIKIRSVPITGIAIAIDNGIFGRLAFYKFICIPSMCDECI